MPVNSQNWHWIQTGALPAALMAQVIQQQEKSRSGKRRGASVLSAFHNNTHHLLSIWQAGKERKNIIKCMHDRRDKQLHAGNTRKHEASAGVTSQTSYNGRRSDVPPRASSSAAAVDSGVWHLRQEVWGIQRKVKQFWKALSQLGLS